MKGLRLQTKLTLVFLALFLSVQGVLLLAFYSTVVTNVGEQVEDQLGASTRVFEQIIAERISVLGEKALVLARDDGFRSVIGPIFQSDIIEAVDSATVQSALENFGRRIDSDLSIIYDVDNNVVAVSSGSIKDIQHLPKISDDLKIQAENDGVASTIVAIDGHIFELVLVPFKAPDIIAWIALGIEFDSAAAEQIKALSPIELEIAFLYQNQSGYHLASTTSSPEPMKQFVRQNIDQDTGVLFRRSFSGQDQLFRHITLEKGNGSQGNISALVYFSMDQALAPYFAVAVALSGVMIVGLILLIVGSMAISNGVTRPLRDLVSASHRIATGDYTEVACAEGNDEITDLTTSFNLMIDAVKEREQRIVFQSNHDIETSLPNRNFFETQIKQAVVEMSEFVVVVAEVQQLLDLRSVLNHTRVNDLIAAIGHRISNTANTQVSRLSTEAFIFIVEDANQGEVTASLLTNAFLTPFDVNGLAVDASVKMGFTRFPEDSHEPLELMQYANSALDQARSVAKGYAWYVASNCHEFVNRLTLMSDFRDALDRDEIKFAYQPKRDIASGKTISVEALVRWISPTRGFVSPDEFIPFAERTGDIKHLTKWGIREAIKQCAEWRAQDIDLVVAVNLSAVDLMNRNLPGEIMVLLQEYGLRPSSLALEVTESAIMHDMTRALHILNILSAVGIKLSIDDYGTGYSSLSYLKKLPVSELKIDKAFVLNLADSDEDKILVRSTIELAHNLGLKVIAEGVEDQVTVDLLTEYGCDTLQGYFICRPVPASEIEAFLASEASSES
ncbi:MAG: EAL domain-containing protein [Pseudomonadales bacterium]|nr:EAL domain-containing protein [Pseudomonadales bacterium]